MATTQVGVREFRDNLAKHMEADGPVAVTRHGEQVGLYIPTRRKRTEADRVALLEAHAQVQQAMKEDGITEEEIFAELDRLHAERKAEWLSKGL